MLLKIKRSHALDRSTTTFTRTIRTLINGAGGVLGFSFVWLVFKDFPLSTFMETYTTPLLLWHVALSLYYISWIFGSNFDVDVQEEVYYEMPKGGQVPFHGFFTIVALVGAAILLGWSAGDIQRFAIAIDIFIIVDHAAWQYLIWLLKPVIRTSRRTYKERQDYFSLEELRVVTHQIQGKWKWWRFIGTMPIVIVIHAFAFSSTIQSYMARITVALVQKLPGAPHLSDGEATAFLSGMLVFLFVLIAEIWSWALRVRTLMYVKCLDDLSVRYVLHPITSSEAQVAKVRPSRTRTQRETVNSPDAAGELN